MFGNKQSAQVDVTVIGRGAVIEGKVSGTGRFQVDGSVEGTLRVQGEVSVGPKGVVQGELTTDELSVGGRVQGRINVRGHLRVLAGGSVSGEVRYASLEIERGGVLDGRAMQGQEQEPDEQVAKVVSIRPEAPAPAAHLPPPLPAAKVGGAAS